MRKKKVEQPEPEEQAEEMAEAAEEPAGLSGDDTKRELARRMMANVRRQLELLERLIMAEEEADGGPVIEFDAELVMPAREGRMIEGVFDGEGMVGEDGRRYSVPANYASKSKLVEGDLLRLDITEDGRFLFKQRGPIERQRLVGELMRDERTGDWKVAASGRMFRVLPASISFFKAEPGDEMVVLVPRSAPSKWAAVENVIKRGE